MEGNGNGGTQHCMTTNPTSTRHNQNNSIDIMVNHLSKNKQFPNTYDRNFILCTTNNNNNNSDNLINRTANFSVNCNSDVNEIREMIKNVDCDKKSLPFLKINNCNNKDENVKQNMIPSIENNNVISRHGILNHRLGFLYDRNIIDCVKNNNLNDIAKNGAIALINEGECSNNNYETFQKSIKQNNTFLKLIHFNAQGLLESTHFENICILIRQINMDIIVISDYLFLEINSSSTKFYIDVCGLYRRGDCSDDETNRVFNKINELGINFEHVFICGDLNANTFDVGKFKKLKLLTDNLDIINDNCPTYIAGDFNPSQLDLIFAKNADDVRCFGHFSALEISNHNAIYAIFNTFTTQKINKTYQFRNLNSIDLDNAMNIAENIDWGEIYNTMDVDQMIDIFYSIMYKYLNDICPLKTVTSRHKPVPWMNKNIREHMDKRKILYDLWKLNRKHQSGPILYSAYHKIDIATKKLIDTSKRENFIGKFNEADTSGDKWNLIHKFGVTRKSRKEITMNLDDLFGLDNLNEQFTSLEPLPYRNLNIPVIQSQFEFSLTNEKTVYKTIMNITSNSTGPDNLPSKLFKIMAKHISNPISHIINTSFNSGIYPSRLKHIAITPIPKVEEPISTAQFRPISNANFLSKIVSKITCSQMNSYLEHNQILSEQLQY